ncbi:MAG: response regulator [Planctomycetaceae bacterium]|nr:response regulator [Planctomycetaceae bacterium]
MSGDLISAECEVDVYRKQLRASRAAFHAIVDRSADGVIVLTPEGLIAFLNPAAETMLGRPAGELYGEPFDIPLTPGAHSEIDLLGSDGTVRVAELRVVATEWQNRQAWLATLRDITEHKNNERRARDAVRRRDEFIALLSHELRNPLAAIRNAGTLVARTASAEGVCARSVDVIERQCRQMAWLLDELLEVTRISQGKIQLKRDPIDLNIVVAESIEALAPQIESGDRHLTVLTPEETVYVEGDMARLHQVVSNLLANAVKYSHPGGNIEVELTADSHDTLRRLVDDGIGIPADLLSEIFEPFIQGNSCLARDDTGLGLGLSLVRSLVELHGGCVKATSEGPGCGSEFSVRLPRFIPKPRDLPPTEVGGPAMPGALRLLIVEDNDDVRDMLQTLLELDGHEVGVARDGREGVEMIESQLPQVAIVDIGLPVLDGYQLAKRVRSQSALKETFLIALTGYGQDDDRRRAMESGFDAHLVKPVDLLKLNELMAERTRPMGPSIIAPECTETFEVPPAKTRLAFIPGRGVVGCETAID